MTGDPVALARELLRCPSVTPVEGGALALIDAVLKDAGFDDSHVEHLEQAKVKAGGGWLALFGKVVQHGPEIYDTVMKLVNLFTQQSGPEGTGSVLFVRPS